MASPTSPPGNAWTEQASHPPKHVQFRRTSSHTRRPSRSIDAVKTDAAGFNEQSPLLAARKSQENDADIEAQPLTDDNENVLSPASTLSWNVSQDEPMEPVESKSSWYLFLLTLSIGGLQIAWSVELSNGSPYLLSLGISKSMLSLVWIAGPLSGVLVQPYVGIKSDRCRSRFGKRRPFMVGGAIATILSLMALAWARELVTLILHGIFRLDQSAPAIKVSSIVFAVLMIYVLDFAINVIQAGIRAFIVDNAPPHQQDSANAWASRVSGVGNIIGYLFGYANLPKYFWFFGDTQFKVLCVIASLGMILTLTISCLAITERDPRSDGEPGPQTRGVFAFFRQLYTSIRRLPPQIKAVCQVQFMAWIGWFPFLFYTTTFIAEIYVDPLIRENPQMTESEIASAWEKGTRIGTFALEIFAITNFAATIILPLIVAKSIQPSGVSALDTATTPLTPSAHPHANNNSDSYFDPPTSSLKSHPSSTSLRTRTRTHLHALYTHLPFPRIPGLTLKRAWQLSHLSFFLLTWSTLFTHTTFSATILVALIGFPWAMTNWAPFALIGDEISTRAAERQRRRREGEAGIEDHEVPEDADQAGTVLGIHNVAIAAPQVLATLGSSLVFRLLQKPRGVPGDESVAWVLRGGGVAALGAAWCVRYVADPGQRKA